MLHNLGHGTPSILQSIYIVVAFMSSVHVSYIPYVSYMVFLNVGNNIKRGKKHEHQNDITSSHMHASLEYCSSRFMLFSTFLAKNIRHIRDIGHMN